VVTAAESPAQGFFRLLCERADLLAANRKAGTADPDRSARFAAVQQRLRELVGTAPEGYALPAQAASLIAHAQAHGWTTLVQWTAPGYEGEPFVTIQVRRTLAADEQPDARGDGWTYQFTWHSRGCPPGRLRLFGRHLATTPDQPWTHHTPSLKAVRDIISHHPPPAGAA
jgi:hypothetical protein